MVAGVRKSLEGGKVYTSDDLSRRFGLRGREFERVLDHLMAQGCVKPVAFDRARAHSQGTPVRVNARFDHQLSWEA